MKPEAYLPAVTIPPDGALAVDLAIPIQRQVVDAEERQEAGFLFGPNVVWRHNVAIQLQMTSSDAVLRVVSQGQIQNAKVSLPLQLSVTYRDLEMRPGSARTPFLRGWP